MRGGLCRSGAVVFAMAHAVILEHRLADGSVHFDWMIEDAGVVGERRLRTWRVGVRPDVVGAFTGERIGDHRAAYLRFEGDIGGGRGCVRRVGSGTVEALVLDCEDFAATIVWDGVGMIEYVGRRTDLGGAGWAFEARVG